MTLLDVLITNNNHGNEHLPTNWRHVSPLLHRPPPSTTARGKKCRGHQTTYYSAYNSCMKILYIVLTAYTVYLIRWKEPICSTYDREQDQLPHWKVIVAPSAVVATVLMCIEDDLVFIGEDQEILWWPFGMSVEEFLWIFSIVLESGAILPQLTLLRRYRMIENLTANYVFFVGIYRLMYIFNWVHRAYNEPGYRHHLVVYIAGVLQVDGCCVWKWR